MKRIIVNNFFITLVVICFCVNIGAGNLKKLQHSNIIATWVSEKDANYKLVFTKDRCYKYYSGKPADTDFYVISNITPQCGETVPVTNYTNYLKLTNIQDSGDYECYEINGITTTHLSLRPVQNGKILVFEKQ